MTEIAEMTGVREYAEGLPVRLRWLDHERRMVVEGFNQDGDNGVLIDLADLVA